MAFSNEANAELKTLNGKTQEVVKNKKKEKELTNFSEPGSQRSPYSWVRD
jgi:hypothetical protein